jgi:hypothetical protein
MMLIKLPYTTEQVIQNTNRLLMASNIFPMREFDTWENSMVKTYPALKTIIHEAYLRRLNLMEFHNTPQVWVTLHPLTHCTTCWKTTTTRTTAQQTSGLPPLRRLPQPKAHWEMAWRPAVSITGLLAAINQSIVTAFNQVVQNLSVLQNQIAEM